MRIDRGILFGIPLLLIGCQAVLTNEPGMNTTLALQADDRILVLSPHPDDEVLGSAGVIQNAVALKIPVHVVFLTLGDFNQWSFAVYRKIPPFTPGQVRQMAEVRHDEAVSADTLLGVPAENITFLGYPDHGTLEIWYRHWDDSPPYRGILTRATAVPYTNAFHPEAAYKGESIVADLTAIIREVQPTKIFVPHPADTHPDHRALYLYTQVVLWNLQDELSPQVYPFLVHYPQWPQPSQYKPSATLEPPVALAESGTWITYDLEPAQVTEKLAALKQHRTQYASGARFLRRFIRTNELFGNFPDVALAADETAVLESAETARLRRSFLAEELGAAERKAFVAVEGVSLRREGEELVATLQFSRPLEPGANVSLYVFGYRPDRLFENMPKLHVQFGRGNRQSAFDQTVALPADSVQITRQGQEATVRIPTALLGEPDRVLITASSTFERVPLDRAPWRVVTLRRRE